MTRSAPEFLGRGLAFPVRVTRSGSVAVLGGAEKVRQAIWVLLSTAPGERVMRPDFGCGVHDLLFQPNTATLRAQVKVKVTESLTRYEPRVDVLSVLVESAADLGNRLDITIEYRLRSNNAVYNLVYPFFLDEGAV